MCYFHRFNNSAQNVFSATCNTTTGQWEPAPPACISEYFARCSQTHKHSKYLIKYQILFNPQYNISEIPDTCESIPPSPTRRVFSHTNNIGDEVCFSCEDGYRFKYSIDDSIGCATCNGTTRKFEPEPEPCVGELLAMFVLPSFKLFPSS